jgi:hypothetical protein
LFGIVTETWAVLVLVAWEESPLYDAVIVSVLGAVPDGVIVTWHVAVAPAPNSVQGEVAIAPVPLLVIVTLPAGVVAVPMSLSVTVTVQMVEEPVLTLDGVQVTLVMVDRLLIVMLTETVVLLVAWAVSPLYAADRLAVPCTDELNITWHVDFPVVTCEMLMHEEPVIKKAPGAIPATLNVTDPVGVSAVPAIVVSVIVAVHVVGWLTRIVVGLQAIVMDAVLGSTVTLVVPELPLWVGSPA